MRGNWLFCSRVVLNLNEIKKRTLQVKSFLPNRGTGWLKEG